MPLDSMTADLALRHRAAQARAAISIARSEPKLGQIALVSSFGSEAIVLLHLAAQAEPDVPVLFLDTGKHFEDTRTYSQQVARDLGLRDLRVLTPDAHDKAKQDPYGALHCYDTEACCALRKTRPLQTALKDFDGWITGRKRYQGGARAQLQVFEGDGATGKLKINPLAHWTRADIADYMTLHALPQHPLVAQGYLSIGCAPCTARGGTQSDPRAGRWPGQNKSECGIHVPPQDP